MKGIARLSSLVLSLAALTLALATLSFAANKNQASFTLPSSARVGSTNLKAGEYKAELKAETGDSVKVDILQHGKTVATVEGKLKNMPGTEAHDAVVLRTLDNNQDAINEIDFGSRKQAVVFGE